MKINLLYVLIPLALGACYIIVTDLQSQSEFTFIGTAETEPISLNMDEDVIVQAVYVEAGAQVEKGDTLAMMYRTDLEWEAINQNATLQQSAQDHQNRLSSIRSQKTEVEVQTLAKERELQAEMQRIELQDSLDQDFRTSIYPNLKIDRTASNQRIAALKDEINQLRSIANQELVTLDLQAKSSTQVIQNKQAETAVKQRFRAQEKNRLVLVAPISGYIDQVAITTQAMVPSYKEMLRIYPLKPNKVIGFVHENAKVPFHIGDEVSLTSGISPNQLLDGRIISSSPKLVELPLRLRKFVEVRAWGREVLIQIPAENQFYIGEKISIALKAPAK
jgi:multidrug resistance efflux pump